MTAKEFYKSHSSDAANEHWYTASGDLQEDGLFRFAESYCAQESAQMRKALQAVDSAFVHWQVGQIPGRPEDILKLIAKSVRLSPVAESTRHSFHGQNPNSLRQFRIGQISK